jgi:ubiquinone/menaquinone biosynthesis C-methylase UbiE
MHWHSAAAPLLTLEADRALKAAHRAMWALGDYDRFARATVWELGSVLVEACGITRGQRVLDVAAGTGNVAIRAATRGAQVVASDLAPEHFAAGRRGATAEGVELEWIEGDAEALPFEDATFDVVTSCFGAMFAPHHQRVADELVRVCRPGGTIGMMSFTPEGRGGEFFALLAPHAPPPPPGAASPVLWGEEYHVRSLFGDRVRFRTLRRQSYVERAASLQAYCRLFTETFGPLVAIRAGLSESARAELDAALFDAVVRWNQGDARGAVSIPYEYLLMVAQRPNE